MRNAYDARPARERVHDRLRIWLWRQEADICWTPATVEQLDAAVSVRPTEADWHAVGCPDLAEAYAHACAAYDEQHAARMAERLTDRVLRFRMRR